MSFSVASNCNKQEIERKSSKIVSIHFILFANLNFPFLIINANASKAHWKMCMQFIYHLLAIFHRSHKYNQLTIRNVHLHSFGYKINWAWPIIEWPILMYLYQHTNCIPATFFIVINLFYFLLLFLMF